MKPLVGHRYLGVLEGSCKFQREDRHFVKSWRDLTLWKVRTRPDEKVLSVAANTDILERPVPCFGPPIKRPSYALLASAGDGFLLR